MKPKLLVIDDDQASCRLLKAVFEPEGFEVVTAPDGETGLERVWTEQPHVVLLDLRLPGRGGLEVLEAITKRMPSLPVIMLTVSLDVKAAVRAIQLGAFNHLNKPFDQDEIVIVVRRALETRGLQSEVEDLRRSLGHNTPNSLAVQMGPGPEVQAIIDQVQTVAASDFTVLILGETGTGKELVSQAIHQTSARRARPLVALDCGAIPEPLLESELFGHEKGAFTGADRRRQGRLRLAERGTCLLDEIGNLPMMLQSKLLRVLESRQVQSIGAEQATPMDVRFIAATNDDLQARVADGRFRADLYFRLAQYTISLPPLRERKEAIPYLAQRFLEEASVELRRPIQVIVPSALDILRAHHWPGNVRELRNVVRQAVLHSKELAIRAETIHASLGRAFDNSPAFARTDGQSLKAVAAAAAEAAERRVIADVLAATTGNKSEAARILKTDYKTLHVKMKNLGISAHDFMG